MIRRVMTGIAALLLIATTAQAIGLGSVARRAGTYSPMLPSAILTLSGTALTASGGANITLPAAILTLAGSAITASEWTQPYDTSDYEVTADGWSTTPFSRSNTYGAKSGSYSFDVGTGLGTNSYTSKTVTNCSTGNITFWYQTNDNYGYYQLDSNATVPLAYTGIGGASLFAQVTIPITAGTHTLKIGKTSTLSSVRVDLVKIPVDSL